MAQRADSFVSNGSGRSRRSYSYVMHASEEVTPPRKHLTTFQVRAQQVLVRKRTTISSVYLSVCLT